MSRLRILLLARRRAVLAFLMLAFVVGALVPAGYMPGAGESRFLDIIVCSGPEGTAKQRIAVPFDEESPSRENLPQPESCAFAALAKVALLSASTISNLAPPQPRVLSGLAPPPASPQPVPAFLRPPTRAPPGAA